MSHLTIPYPFEGGFQVSDAYTWLESRGIKVSPGLGRIVATIIARVFRGIYNAPLAKGSDAKWDSEAYICLSVYGGLSSFDFDSLTRLVVLCHDACIRVEVNPCNMRYLELVFHPRAARQGSMFDRHPTLESAAAAIRGLKPTPDPDSQGKYAEPEGL